MGLSGPLIFFSCKIIADGDATGTVRASPQRDSLHHGIFLISSSVVLIDRELSVLWRVAESVLRRAKCVDAPLFQMVINSIMAFHSIIGTTFVEMFINHAVRKHVSCTASWYRALLAI